MYTNLRIRHDSANVRCGIMDLFWLLINEIFAVAIDVRSAPAGRRRRNQWDFGTRFRQIWICIFGIGL